MGVAQEQATAAIEDLMIVRDYARANELVRTGIDSSHLVIAEDIEEHTALERAQLGVSENRGPLPLRPYASGYKCLVLLPTYNERENIERVVRDVLAYLDTDVLIIDDGSPDGTGDVADALARELPRVTVIHREGKLGLGTAYLRGFQHAIDHGYERVFEMDSDFSHPPWDLPRLVAESRDAELVIGSRYVAGGSTEGWDLKRRVLSRGANLYARVLLFLPVRDATAGFRCYDVDTLSKLDLGAVRAEGYAFQVEMLYRVLRAGHRVREVPIHFTDRAEGQSKMDAKIAREAIWLVPQLRWRVR